VTPGCLAPEVAGVRSVEVVASDGGLESASPRSVGCFAIGSGDYLVHRPFGRGVIVALGGWSFLTNEFLRQADNAVLARDVMGPGPVVFGPPVPPGRAARGRGIWASLPRRAKVVLVLLALSVVAFALVRARRLGRPVLEEPVSPIPGTELVAAAAALYRRSRASAYCGTLLRTETATRLSRRLGVPRDSGPDALARAVASTTGRAEEDVRHAFEGPEPHDDEELMALGRELEEIARSVEAR
jgi:hypothetical protein